MSSFPEAFHIGQAGHIEKLDPAFYDNDPRGIVWMWEPPNKYSQYCLGCDPTNGLTGWNRFSRVKEDRKINNGAIEIFRFTKAGMAYQVAEFASPNDAFELGYIANLLGRLYAGIEEDQCKCILETYPGPGGMTLRQMTECGYMNFWKWEYYAEQTPAGTKSVGWTATNRSNRDLWTKSSRVLIKQQAVIRSPFLVEEYADARFNADKGYAENPANDKGHGDRVRAANLALWAGFGWSMDLERTDEAVTTAPQDIDWQNTDMTWDDIQDRWSAAMDRLSK